MREGDTVDVSLSELSKQSGLNSALVKYYFGNKAGLLKALLDRDWQAIVSSVDATCPTKAMAISRRFHCDVAEDCGRSRPSVLPAPRASRDWTQAGKSPARTKSHCCRRARL